MRLAQPDRAIGDTYYRVFFVPPQERYVWSFAPVRVCIHGPESHQNKTRVPPIRYEVLPSPPPHDNGGFYSCSPDAAIVSVTGVSIWTTVL